MTRRYELVSVTGYSCFGYGRSHTSYSVIDTAYNGVEVFTAYADRKAMPGFTGRPSDAERRQACIAERDRLNSLDRQHILDG